MATSEKPRPSSEIPSDLLAVIRTSGVLTEKLFADIKSKVLHGDYPNDSTALAGRLVKDKVLSEYQARRFLSNKPHGLVIGKYVIVDRLGAGSMGRVYLANHAMMGRHVAVKIIAPEIVSNERVVSRFQREMKLVGRLAHPNVIRAFDADQLGKLLYIVMEYVPGLTLSQYLRKGGLEPLAMAEYGAQAARGLAHAHEQGIVHRDIKPSNILLTDDQQVKVLDLGLGVLMEADTQSTFATADGIAVGTVDYMSPEQACGRDVDGRTDLFSLGCTMYHLITGQLAFPGDNPIERMGKRINGRPVPITEVRPDIPRGLVRVIETLMAHKPQDRYSNANEAAEALQAVLRPKVRASQPPEIRESSKEQGRDPSGPNQPLALAAPVLPVYPAWFRGIARLAEQRPILTLCLGLATLLGSFALGFLAARVF